MGNSVKPVSAMEVGDLLAHEFPPREEFLGQWLTRQSLSMVHAWRGVGKTYFALEVAYATASGGQYLRWTAPEPRRVLYLDGEMPGYVLQERVARIAASATTEPPPGFLQFVTPDIQTLQLPDLATDSGQERLARLVDAADLIVVDNLSCLARRGGRENEAESWLPVADWALRQRVAGRSVLFVHHSGKGGLQRGTSRREDVLDVVIALRRPADYHADEGCRFILTFEKARGVTGDEVAEFEACLRTDGEWDREWTIKSCEDAELNQLVELVRDGAAQHEVAEEMHLSRFQVRRRISTAIEKGLLNSSDIRDGRKKSRD